MTAASGELEFRMIQYSKDIAPLQKIYYCIKGAKLIHRQYQIKIYELITSTLPFSSLFQTTTGYNLQILLG